MLRPTPLSEKDKAQTFDAVLFSTLIAAASMRARTSAIYLTRSVMHLPTAILLDKVPENKRETVHAELREAMHAARDAIARRRMESLARSLQLDYQKPASCVRDDLDRQSAFYRKLKRARTLCRTQRVA